MSLLALRALLNQQGASWSPADLTDVAHWWDSSDDGSFTFSSGTDVSQWNDLIGSAHLAQATGANQPNRASASSGVLFTSGDWLDSGAVTIAQPFTFLVACNITDLYSAFFSGGTGASSPQMFVQDSKLWTYAGSLGITTLALEDIAASVIATFNGASSGAWVNGSSGGTLSIGTTGVTLFRTDERAHESSYRIEGYLYEMAVTTSVVSADDRAAWDDYITAKWL